MILNRTILLSLLTFLNTTIYSQKSTATDSTATLEIDSKIFQRVEVEATYPGGEQAWRSFLEKNLNPNTPINNNAPAGQYTVIVQFVVSKTGAVSDLRALTSNG